MNQKLLNWTSKVQIKKGTPLIAMIKHLTNAQRLYKGKELHCTLCLEENRVIIKVYLDGMP